MVCPSVGWSVGRSVCHYLVGKSSRDCVFKIRYRISINKDNARFTGCTIILALSADMDIYTQTYIHAYIRSNGHTGCSGKIVFFFIIYCNPSLAYISLQEIFKALNKMRMYSHTIFPEHPVHEYITYILNHENNGRQKRPD